MIVKILNHLTHITEHILVLSLIVDCGLWPLLRNNIHYDELIVQRNYHTHPDGKSLSLAIWASRADKVHKVRIMISDHLWLRHTWSHKSSRLKRRGTAWLVISTQSKSLHLWWYGGVSVSMQLETCTSGKASSILKGIYRLYSNICSCPDDSFFQSGSCIFQQDNLNYMLLLFTIWKHLEHYETQYTTKKTQNFWIPRVLFQTGTGQHSSPKGPAAQFPLICFLYSVESKTLVYGICKSMHSVFIYILHSIPTFLELRLWNFSFKKNPNARKIPYT